MTIGIWGDSITYGSCDGEALGWVGRLRKVLVSNDDNEVYNFGICGNTSADVVNRFKIEAEAIEPTHIVFAIGINDSKYVSESEINKVPLVDYVKNMESLIESAKLLVSRISIVGATRVDDGWRFVPGSRFLNEEIERYNKAMKEVSERHGAVFIDVFDVLDQATDLADGLHPNAQGYEKMFERIRGALVLE